MFRILDRTFWKGVLGLKDLSGEVMLVQQSEQTGTEVDACRSLQIPFPFQHPKIKQRKRPKAAGPQLR